MMALPRWIGLGVFAAVATLGFVGWGEPVTAPNPLIEKMQGGLAALDADENHKSADSGTLAWGEATVLTTFYWMYEATGDTAWLDRIRQRADVIFSNLSPGDELQPGWRTTRYSVAIVEAVADGGNTSRATIKPDPARISDIETAHKVTGHDYELRVTPAGAIEATDKTTGEQLGVVDMPEDGHIKQIPGVVLFVEGELQAGDRFIVRTQAPKPMEYIVHDGMILTPIAKFCAAVLSGERLTAMYGDAARRYLHVMETQLIPKWEPYWHDVPDGMGVYAFQNDPAQRFPGASLPHNQYLALARTHIALYRITGKALYRGRAERMARFFKRNLRLVGSHYEWNYWDYAGPWDEEARRMAHVEDTSHGHIDIGFVVDAYDAGIVFDREDMEHFARTVSDAMWNGSEDKPRVGARVDRSDGDKVIAFDWLHLGRFSPQTRRIMMGMLDSLGSLGGANVGAAAQALAVERLDWSPEPRHTASAGQPRQ
ncbi:MAG: hypothetical protein JSV65_09395 [Armatimonadota bacterium]|nr:MAG: hypothetical protein JSV65_09395 [Armatimonadota bacterium]